MFNKLSKYEKWINANKARLIEEWECGFMRHGTPISASTFEDYVADMWDFEKWKQTR